MDKPETDRTLRDLRTGVCLKDLPPIFRNCGQCSKLYTCLHGEDVVFGDHSITHKVIELDWVVSSPEDLKKFSLDELLEYNKARDMKDQIQETRRKQEGLTAGFYDTETDSWKDGKKIHIQTDRKQKRKLSVGYWDDKKERWVSE